MHRDATARSRIKEYLRSHGPVEDPSGHATRVLRQAVDYQGSAVAFIQMLAAMDRDGELERTIVGKRTYRVEGLADSASALVPVHSSDPSAGAPVALIDYERLAKAIVSELADRLSTPSGSGSPAVNHMPSQSTNTAAAERARLVQERDDYAARLHEARHRLDELLGDEPAAGEARLDDASPLFRKPANFSS
ncbi:hypothetical protein [Aeromicrobium fastidiosum]|uniref:Uncharacterized protein n=1 Tax=Aeromicrobium fastidiosum TaxID=52699 RepID=A0A641APA1_9ACTN|nr:hypothetical protein [Aeromicrobium fastidiosum]KAA1379924.1 hypothetical protein ESP62_001545 [Aeromicrobium fastidiosum]MBP2389430.1 hypothetical protein [Aeromicrobium fastidiosum]